jgi:hypothetical protein
MQVLLNLLPEEIEALRNLASPIYKEGSAEHFQNLVNKILETVESEKDDTIHTVFHSPTMKNVTLGRQLIFDPHTNLSLTHKGTYIRFPHAESIFHHFGIGKDHVGYLVMTRQAWEAFNAPEPVEITH